MELFIRHKCVERKNTVGHRCYTVYFYTGVNFTNIYTQLLCS